jgi:hypothetical protein
LKKSKTAPENRHQFFKAFETTDDSLILEYLKNWNQQFIKNSKELPNIHLYLGCNQKQTALIGN